MAYAYPAAEITSLQHQQQQTPSHKRMSDPGVDVLREFKHKISEDENYIQFFQDRIRVEETYVENLTKLYDRSIAIDSLHDEPSRRGPKSTARRAWQEVRDYTQREIEAREAMVGALKEDVVHRLVAVKETQSRIRQRIREDMKHSTEMYEEHALNKVPKLKKNYWAKCQALEDLKRQEHAVAMQAKLLSSAPGSPGTTTLQEHPFTHVASPPSGPISPPTTTAPLPPLSNPAIPPGFADVGPWTPGHGAPSSSISFSPSAAVSKSNVGRNRAGSGSGSAFEKDSKSKDVLNDIAAQSKKGFNAFISRLGGDKGERDREEGVGGMPGSSTGGDEGAGLQRKATSSGSSSKAAGAMKGVKAKRDVDEADKAYRLGVFHLESLRLRREKLHSSAITSLEQFNEELNSTLQITLERYIDALHGTAATNAQATEVAREAVHKVNLERDMMLFRSRLPSINASRTALVLYENYYVGACRSLIFGVSLSDYDFARGDGSDRGRPPIIVEKCIAAIDAHGLDAEGIYRISGRHIGVQKIVQAIEVDEEKFLFDERDDVFSITNVLKQYLRELPEPPFPLPHAERVKHTENRGKRSSQGSREPADRPIETHVHSNFSVLRGRLRRLPPIHQTTFQAIIEHLGRVQTHSMNNKMDAKNLSVVFSMSGLPTLDYEIQTDQTEDSALFGQDQLPTDGNVLNMHQEKDTVLEDLITYADLLFGDEAISQAPTVLPPGAALSRNGVLSYYPPEDGLQPGSSRTRVRVSNSASRNPPSSLPLRSSEEAQPTVSPPVFTPDSKLDLMFDPMLIPATMKSSLPPDLHVRPLSSTDFLRSHFGLLASLTTAPPLAPSVYMALFSWMKTCPGTYYILVLIEKATDQVVACGSLIAEKKFIRGAGKSGHIEDIVVSDSMQGKGLGLALVKGLKELGEIIGCYKVILDCKEDKIETPSPSHLASGSLPIRGTSLPPIQPTDTSQAKVDSPLRADGPYVKLSPDPEDDVGRPTTSRTASSGSSVTYSYPVERPLDGERRSATPLPPGALPPDLVNEPQRLRVAQQP
ncbi:glucosamine-phosphate N-acetyltransferase, partial [Tremellales sp. Uapishka_1]